MSLMPFLRPIGSPKPATVRHFLRFSTRSACRDQIQPKGRTEDPNLVASRTASPSYPPPSMGSLPRPKESKASRRTSHPPKERHYPTRQPSHSRPATNRLIPEFIGPLSAEQRAPNLPYFVTRTPSNELPIYQERKRGGNLMLTRVKKIHGNVEKLRDGLRMALGLDKDDCVVNSQTRHVVVKGHCKPKIEQYLRERLF